MCIRKRAQHIACKDGELWNTSTFSLSTGIFVDSVLTRAAELIMQHPILDGGGGIIASGPAL